MFKSILGSRPGVCRPDESPPLQERTCEEVGNGRREPSSHNVSQETCTMAGCRGKQRVCPRLCTLLCSLAFLLGPACFCQKEMPPGTSFFCFTGNQNIAWAANQKMKGGSIRKHRYLRGTFSSFPVPNVDISRPTADSKTAAAALFPVAGRATAMSLANTMISGNWYRRQTDRR